MCFVEESFLVKQEWISYDENPAMLPSLLDIQMVFLLLLLLFFNLFIVIKYTEHNISHLNHFKCRVQ